MLTKWSERQIKWLPDKLIKMIVPLGSHSKFHVRHTVNRHQQKLNESTKLTYKVVSIRRNAHNKHVGYEKIL